MIEPVTVHAVRYGKKAAEVTDFDAPSLPIQQKDSEQQTSRFENAVLERAHPIQQASAQYGPSQHQNQNACGIAQIQVQRYHGQKITLAVGDNRVEQLPAIVRNVQYGQGQGGVVPDRPEAAPVPMKMAIQPQVQIQGQPQQQVQLQVHQRYPAQVVPEPTTLCDGRFKILATLGEGSYGKVYRVYDSLRQSVMALKKVKFLGKSAQGIPQSSLRELAILKELKHPNIVKLEDIIGNREAQSELFLLFPLSSGDLRTFTLTNPSPLSLTTIRQIMKGLLQGVDYLHGQRIVHRDIKPENVLVDRDAEGVKVRVADFGLARTVHMPLRPYSKEILSLWYRSPELCLGYKNYSIGVDTWAIGCIFYELITGEVLFKGRSDTEMIHKIFKTFGTPTGDKWSWVSKLNGYRSCLSLPVYPPASFASVLERYPLARECPSVVEIIEGMLRIDPLDRLTCQEALSHPFFQ